jgi:hypothetical protein
MENGDVSSGDDSSKSYGSFRSKAAGSKNRYSAERGKTCSYSFLFAFEHLMLIMLIHFRLIREVHGSELMLTNEYAKIKNNTCKLREINLHILDD